MLAFISFWVYNRSIRYDNAKQAVSLGFIQVILSHSVDKYFYNIKFSILEDCGALFIMFVGIVFTFAQLFTRFHKEDPQLSTILRKTIRIYI